MITNIVSILYTYAREHPDKIAIQHGDTSVTYAMLASHIRRCAAHLCAKGVREGDRILMFVPMSIELYTCMLGIWHCGATAVFLDAWSRKERLEQAAAIAECKVFIGTAQAYILRLFSPGVRKIPITVFAGTLQKQKQGIVEPAVAQLSDDAVALITFTTGSTGVPKAAKRTHAFLQAQHAVLTDHLKPAKDDIDMVTLPIFVLTNLAAGITSYLPPGNPAAPERVNPRILVSAIKKHRVTTSAGSPVMYNRLAEYCISQGIAVPSLRKIFLGGAPVFPRLAGLLVKAFPETAIEIVFGSTEAEPISTLNATMLVSHDRLTAAEGLLVGKPVQAISARIVQIIDGPIQVSDQEQFDSLVLSHGEIGEICVSGKHVLKEYFRNEEAQKQNKIIVNTTIWHRTGDAGYLSEDGNLYLMGRVKQRFTYKGIWWYLFPLEESLSYLPEVKLGTYVHIEGNLFVIIESDKKSPNKTDIINYCRENNMPIPDAVLIQRIPRDPRHNSKIDYNVLKKKIRTRIAADAD